jgi:hypothetical protein
MEALELSMVLKAFFTIYRFAFSWFERNFAFFLAVTASSLVHFPWSKTAFKPASVAKASIAEASVAVSAKLFHRLIYLRC